MKANTILRFVGFLLLVTFVAGNSLNADRLSAESMVYEDFVIPVTNGEFTLIAGPRDYYTLIVFTSTDEKHGCELCVTLKDIVSHVSRAWSRDHGSLNSLFFLNVDIIDETNIPLIKQLEFNTIPHIWLIPPNKDADGFDELAILKDPRYIFQVPLASLQEQTKELARFLTEIIHQDVKVDAEDPIDRFLKTFVITLSVIVLIKKKGPSYIASNGKKIGFTIFCILLVLLFVCGYQFTTMRGVPFVARNDKNEIIVISGGTSYQFGFEVILVGFNYASLAATLITLIYVGGYEVTASSRISDNKTKFVLVCVLNLILYLLYSLLTSIYLRKDPGYPYAYTKLI